MVHLLYESYLLRKNLVPSPSTDAELLFERSELRNMIDRILFNLFNMKAKVQILFYGSRGSGKTHLLAHFRSRIFRKYNIYPIEVDFLFARTPFQLYFQALYYILQSGCLDAFLDFIKVPGGFGELRKLTKTPSCLPTVYVNINRDISKLKNWIIGGLHDRSPTLPNIEDPRVETDVLTCILRFYYCVFKKHLYPILIADHCETLVNDLITYVRSNEKVEMARLLSRMIDFSSCILAVDSDKVDDFKRVLYPKSSAFESHEISPLNKDDVNMFLSDIRNTFVNVAAATTLSELRENEKIDSATYPLTQEAQRYLEKLSPIQPGQLTRLLQRALELSVRVREGYFITEKDIKQIIVDIAPTLLYTCRRCEKRLKMTLVRVRDLGYGRPGKVERVACSECGANVSHLLSLVLDTVVLDSSSLANLDFSSLYEEFHKLYTKRLKILVPSAVLSELSAWEKKEEKRGLYRIARWEYQKLVSLDTAGKIQLLSEVGRKPTFAEIREATRFNSIDRIIIEVAKVHNATLLTRDKGMATNSLNKARFTVLFHGRDRY